MPIRPEMNARYPKDWALRSRFVRYFRARNRCEWCGVPNGAWRHGPSGEWTLNADTAATWSSTRAGKVSKVVLTCAHVHDHRPEASSLLNLAALCQRCHNRHDAPMRQAHARERRRRASGQMELDV